MRTGHRDYGVAAAILMTVVMGNHAAAQGGQFTERQVIFRNGSVELRGTLMLPAVRTPSPAVVFLHGSGPHPRAGFRPYADEFARSGSRVSSSTSEDRGSREAHGLLRLSRISRGMRWRPSTISRLKRESIQNESGSGASAKPAGSHPLLPLAPRTSRS